MEESLRMASHVFNWTNAIELSGHDLTKPVHTSSQRSRRRSLTSKTPASVHSSAERADFRGVRAEKLGISVPELDAIAQVRAMGMYPFSSLFGAIC